jgi:hypothetical protein
VSSIFGEDTLYHLSIEYSKAQGRELYGNKGPCEVGPAAEGFTWCKNMIKVYFLLPKIPNWFN